MGRVHNDQSSYPVEAVPSNNGQTSVSSDLPFEVHPNTDSIAELPKEVLFDLTKGAETADVVRDESIQETRYFICEEVNEHVMEHKSEGEETTVEHKKQEQEEVNEHVMEHEMEVEKATVEHTKQEQEVMSRRSETPDKGI